MHPPTTAQSEPSLIPLVPADEYKMRAPCRCGETRGYITTRTGQDTVRCLSCHTFQYNAPRLETGKAQRSVSTRPNLKPSRRWRIIERDGGRCILCGATGNLHVDHLISRIEAAVAGLLDGLIDSDDNLATFCEECNLGKGEHSINPQLMYRTLVVRAKQSKRTP